MFAQMRVFLLRGFFLNSVNYNCARIHFSVAHFGPFNCCAFWTFHITIAQVRVFLLRILNDINYLGACARLSTAHVRFNSASIVHRSKHIFLHILFICYIHRSLTWAFIFCASLLLCIHRSSIRAFIHLRIYLSVHPSFII